MIIFTPQINRNKMSIAYFNGQFLPKEQIMISPDDRGFLFADGIYEVLRWYEGFFFDMPGHTLRLNRSLRELRIKWDEAGSFQNIVLDLIKINGLEKLPSMIYLQVTRGASKRSHTFPKPEVKPTVYAYAWDFNPESLSGGSGIKVMLKEDIRWTRCDIKSVALLPNTLCFQEASENGMQECVFVRNGYITEASHSNIFFVIDKTLYTHPESNLILSGITRKNVLRIAENAGIKIREEAVPENRLRLASEAFITNTSAEVSPVIEIGGNTLGEGIPGPITNRIIELFKAEITSFKG